VALAPSGDELAFGAMPATIHFYDAATGKHLRRTSIKGEEYGSTKAPLRYSPSGEYITAKFRRTYHVIRAKSGELFIQGKIGQGQILGLSFTADSKRLFVQATTPPIQVWDLERREIVNRSQPNRPQENDRGTSVSSDGRFVTSSGQEIVVHDLDANAEVARLASDEGEKFMETAFMPDDKRLVAATQQGTIYAWNVGDWSRKWKLASETYFSQGLAMRPMSQDVALIDARSRIWLWDLETGKLRGDDRPVHDASVTAVAFSPDGTQLATGSDGKDTHLWDAATGMHLRHM
jgi:WD40 repeat protein